MILRLIQFQLDLEVVQHFMVDLISRFKSERGVALANASTGSTTASSTIV